MPNATSVWDFSDGEILTAAKLDDVNCGIHVFANSTARTNAYGGTGERTLVEGEFSYLADTNVTAYYDGAAWQTLGGGLAVVKTETAFSAVSSLTADSVFSSSYTNYKMIVRFTTSAADLGMQFRASGVDTTSAYNWQQLRAASTTVSGVRSALQTSAIIADGTSGSFYALCSVDISGPNLAEPTVFSSVVAKTAATYNDPSAEMRTGNQNSSTQFDGIKLLVSSGTMTGSYTIYGYGK